MLSSTHLNLIKVTPPIPTISMSTDGKVTASVLNKKGYLTADITTSNYIQLNTKAAQIYTPSTSDQVIGADQYLIGAQTIKGDSNLISSNIISGISIFGVSGSLITQTYYTGTGEPASNLGSNGDLYLMIGN